MTRIPYWYLIAIPLLLIFSGTVSNQLVFLTNDGKFPVMVNQKELEAMTSPDTDVLAILGITKPKKAISSPDKSNQFIDSQHTVMVPENRLKFLADWINLGEGIYSPGDMAIMLGEYLWTFAPIAWLALVIRKLVED
jgi:hypothetical protein